MSARDDLAALLSGREYRQEITKAEEAAAKAAGLLVIVGASDDLMEFRGAIHDELGAYDGATAMIYPEGALLAWEDFDEKDDEEMVQTYFANKKRAAPVEALWCAGPDYSWTFKTEIPQATFEIVEDDDKYCRGIVIDIKDLR